MTEDRMWPHLSQEEENRRWHIAEELQGNQNEELNDDATSVLCFRELRKYGVEDLYIYARDPNYPYAGGSSWLSWKLCEMNDIAPDGSWLEGEASELRTERPRFETLIDSGTLKLWEIMAANPACPGDLIDRMVRVPEQDNDHEQVRFCAAHNPSTPPETLAWLINRDYTPDEDSESEDDDPCTEVREVALRNPATPLESLLRWSTFKGLGMWHLDDGRSERSAVAANWALPVDVMERLSVDAVDNVRAAIAGNPCCPVTLLEQLSLDSDERGFVRRAIRSNPSSSDLARERADSPRDSGLSLGDGGVMADRFCTSCGDARDGEARFCGSCGAKFADAAGETADPPVDRVRAAGDRATPLVKEEVVTMSTTNFDKKCEILGNLWSFYKDTDNEEWQEFFNWSDLGCPMAYLQWQGMVTIETESRHLIDDTWEVFCGMIEIDVDGSYDSLKGAFDASSNAPIT